MNLVRRVRTLEQRSLAIRAATVEAVPLEHPADVLELLSEQVNALRADPLIDPVERARTLGLLAALALRAMDSRDLQARLEAVERVLKLRREKEREDQSNKRRRGRHGWS
jgi:hypothetical protein